MAIIAGDWVPGALVRFGDLRFIVNLQGDLERTCSPICSTDTASSDSVVDSPQGLQLNASRADALVRTQHLFAGHAGSEQQCLQWQ